jgi:hypothetical protein
MAWRGESVRMKGRKAEFLDFFSDAYLGAR